MRVCRYVLTLGLCSRGCGVLLAALYVEPMSEYSYHLNDPTSRKWQVRSPKRPLPHWLSRGFTKNPALDQQHRPCFVQKAVSLSPNDYRSDVVGQAYEHAAILQGEEAYGAQWLLLPLTLIHCISATCWANSRYANLLRNSGSQQSTAPATPTFNLTADHNGDFEASKKRSAKSVNRAHSPFTWSAKAV